jgi:hypothetical protein
LVSKIRIDRLSRVARPERSFVARPIDSRDNGSRPVSRRRRDSHGVAICAIVAIADQ